MAARESMAGCTQRAPRDLREKVRLHDSDAFRKPKPSNVLIRTRHRAWIKIRGDHAVDPTPRKDRGKHPGARADIESNTR